MVYKISGFYIDINSIYPNVHTLCQNYCCEQHAGTDFSITTTEADIDFEIEVSKANNAPVSSSRGYMEELAVYRKICENILNRDGFLMHGVLLEYEKSGYLFTANSGTGKTTHVKLWQEVFGESVRIINGDKPILRFVDGELYGYGTPWCGKEGYNINTSVKLCGICFIERGEMNSIKKLDADSAVMRIFPQVMIADSSDLGKQLELIDKLLCKVPTYLLKCNMDPEAAKVAYEGMKKAAQ